MKSNSPLSKSESPLYFFLFPMNLSERVTLIHKKESADVNIDEKQAKAVS